MRQRSQDTQPFLDYKAEESMSHLQTLSKTIEPSLNALTSSKDSTNTALGIEIQLTMFSHRDDVHIVWKHITRTPLLTSRSNPCFVRLLTTMQYEPKHGMLIRGGLGIRVRGDNRFHCVVITLLRCWHGRYIIQFTGPTRSSWKLSLQLSYMQTE